MIIFHRKIQSVQPQNLVAAFRHCELLNAHFSQKQGLENKNCVVPLRCIKGVT